MTRVEFHVLLDDQPAAADRYACTLCEQAYGAGRQVLLYCADEDHCARLDGLLWSFRDSSFLPHGRLGPSAAPVLIASAGTASGEAPPERPLLINLSDHMPPGFEHFEDVCELVYQTPARLQLARTHYRHYRACGCTLEHHRLRQRILSHSV